MTFYKTHIEWTDATWSPITGCTPVDEGCRNCYAAELAASRLAHHPSRAGLARRSRAGVAAFTGEVRFNDQWLDQPLRWRKPRMIFVCANGDLFHENVPDEWIDKVFAVMALSPQHTFQVLTKRPDRANTYMRHVNAHGKTRHEIVERTATTVFAKAGEWMTESWPLSNVWLGTSVSDQASADERIPALLDTPAALHFVSAEPLLGPVDLGGILTSYGGLYPLTGVRSDDSGPSGFSQGPRVGWVICGGESGKNARQMHPDWARSLRDQCTDAGVPFLFKQWGAKALNIEGDMP